MKKFNIFHPIFLLLVIWFSISGNIIVFCEFFLALVLHEAGHFFVAKRLGYQLNKFYLTPYGVCLNYNESLFSGKDEIKIAFAGPFVNIATSVVLISFWWVNPTIYCFTEGFVVQSLALAFFNLLPVYPLDGGRIIVAALSKKYRRKKVLKVTKVANICIALLLFICFIASCFINYNCYIVLPIIFLLVGVLDINNEIKYQKICFIKKRKKNFEDVRIVYIKSSANLNQILNCIQKEKFTLFYIEFSNNKLKILPEDKLIDLAMISPLDTKICHCFTNVS